MLLKPQSEIGAQVVVRGKVIGSAAADTYQEMKPALLPQVLESFAILKREADLVLVEGAGSASEINLRANDIANMGFARAAGVPVVLVGDIERGGVIASLVGTKAVLDPHDAGMIVGFIVNKFRGDRRLFDAGLAAIARATGWSALGLVPFFPDAELLPAEDALALDRPTQRRGDAKVKIAVPVLPRIANFDDLDPLVAEPAVELVRVKPDAALPADADLVILPGSKATIADMKVLRASGLEVDIRAHVRRRGLLLGLCGGYQMLGRSIADPEGFEGPPGTVDGLGFLDVATVLTGEKRLSPVAGSTSDGAPFKGYEMHLGVTTGPDRSRPFARFADGADEGARSPDGRVFGTYIHGLFADDAQRSAWLVHLGAGVAAVAHDDLIESTLDRLAAHLAAHVDLDRLLSLSR